MTRYHVQNSLQTRVLFIIISYTALDILKDNRQEKGGKTETDV